MLSYGFSTPEIARPHCSGAPSAIDLGAHLMLCFAVEWMERAIWQIMARQRFKRLEMQKHGSQNILFTKMQTCHCLGKLKSLQRQVSWKNLISDFPFYNSQSLLWLVLCLVELLTRLTGSKSPGLRSCLVTCWKPWWAHNLKQISWIVHDSWCSNFFWNSSSVRLKNRINLSSGNPHNNVAIGRSSRPPSWRIDGKLWSQAPHPLNSVLMIVRNVK